ncbi:50S ribosomal protein L25 [Marinisporobacter balticus]|uniref:Large ribosomal subunit protein bL25 n=1 Tax=Marinisporobacter balticus TaxID=2018667 RepID=A0A4R2KP77_9FIRM|nr:50S ribosomal protein L25 [Marinisporobacter balticus]TCO72639.1 large subunit ribosomal protein L25 [Marinisporobacter balticus]
MLQSNVRADIRGALGSNASHRVRNIGHVPGVVYGRNLDTKCIEIDTKEMDKALRSYGTNVLVDLQIGSEKYTTLVKDVQRDPLTGHLVHIDFQQVCQNERIHTTVPIKLIGKEKVESSISVIQQQLREVHIECLPNHIPESVEVDVSLLSSGNPLKIADVEFGEELSILNEPYEIVVALTRAERIVESSDEEENLFEKVIEGFKDIK